MKTAESILLPIQALQQKHDLLAHRDILNLDTQTLLKHMILHFLKYSGKMAHANYIKDENLFQATLVDTVIICLATANCLNVSLGKALSTSASNLNDLTRELASSLSEKPHIWGAYALVTLSGKMAKSIESTDHLEKGNPRSELEDLIKELAKEMLAVVGAINFDLENDIHNRWRHVEAKSIFSKLEAA